MRALVSKVELDFIISGDFGIKAVLDVVPVVVFTVGMAGVPGFAIVGAEVV